MVTSNKKFYEIEKSSSENLHFVNALIVDIENENEFKGEVLVENGIIKEVSHKKITTPKNYKKIDCKGLILAPALIDAEVHTGEGGGSYKENIMQTSKSAIAGGVGTINILPDTEPAIDTTVVYEFLKNRASEKSYCNVTLFGSITKNLEGKELSEIGLLKKAGIKGVSDCSNYLVDSLVFKRACEYASNFGLTVAQIPNDKFLSDGGVINDGETSTKLGVQGVSAISEKIGLERDLAIVELTKAKYHAFDISTKEAVECIKNAKKNKQKVTASTTPHHIILTDKMAENYRTYAKIYPPLKTEKDNKAIIWALKEGVLDFVSSNHSPRSADQKRKPLQSAEFGAIGVETLLPSVYTTLSKNGFKLWEIFKILSTNPAKFLNIKNKGLIKKDFIADIILLDINSNIKITPEFFSGKAINTPFDELTFKGKVKQTYIEGRLVYENI